VPIIRSFREIVDKVEVNSDRLWRPRTLGTASILLVSCGSPWLWELGFSGMICVSGLRRLVYNQLCLNPTGMISSLSGPKKRPRTVWLQARSALRICCRFGKGSAGIAVPVGSPWSPFRAVQSIRPLQIQSHGTARR